ncbi:MAG: hypothetical protein VX741_12875 [Pseudomonadota bacterium]|nr:hypothetical protein [Pseudomonadota bacterium]
MADDNVTSTGWEPPDRIEKDELVRISDRVLAEREIPYSETEDIFRINANGMDWDIGNIVYAPDNDSDIAIGPDGKKLAIFMTHGGASDWRSIEILARTFCGKRGYKICSMTYPGRFYFDNPEHDWPNDTFHDDGTVRTPVWLKGENITPDQYDLETNNDFREIYGTRRYAVAKPGSNFHVRMAAWPKAIVEAMKDICARHFPPDEWTIYVHGHSTGGPFVHTLMQRVGNIRGLIGIENSPFGLLFRDIAGHDWPTPFNYVLVRDWRELARYKGAELALQEGEKPLFRLAQVMEEVFDLWANVKRFPQFKAENWYHNRTPSCLTEAAQVSAEFQGLNKDETEALVAEYLDYGVPLAGDGVKPVPPLLHGICEFSRDHTVKNYQQLGAAYADMTPAPKFRFIQLGTGIHSYWRAEDGLPLGVCPIVTEVWHDAIMNGFYDD